ncbi:hypothetical protein AVEN_980-1 [Araneus ventricosus]|uniref:Mitochondrial protein n=1 Tax=Araneus ventricosus TaxID=182803 RepID=A0A4Y2CWF8_ARAVE|nr:hypothetical protein AVEN_980-1 [Araneus ventricosus]
MLKGPSNERNHTEEKLDEKEQKPTSDAKDGSEENEQEITSDTEEDNDDELKPSRLEIELHKNGSIEISQKAYARSIFQHFGFEGYKPAPTPTLKESRLQKPEDTKRQEFPYRQAVGALMYLIVETRPDIAYSIGYLSRLLASPSAEDVVRVKSVPLHSRYH